MMLFEKCSPLLIKSNTIGLKGICDLFALGKFLLIFNGLSIKI